MSEQDCATEVLDELCLVVVNRDASWMELTSTLAVALTAILSAVAVGVSVWLARKANITAENIAKAQSKREVQAFRAARKAELRNHAKNLLTSANLIETLLNPRVSELLSVEAGDGIDQVLLRERLAQLQTETSLIASFNSRAAGQSEESFALLPDLLEAAAWVSSDAFHLAILVLESNDQREPSPVDLGDKNSVVDYLLNGSSDNLESRLLENYSQGGGAEHEAWQNAYDRREELLLASSIVTGEPLPRSIEELAARSLSWVSTRRFEDLVNQVLNLWDQE